MSEPLMPISAPAAPPSHMLFTRVVSGGAEPVSVTEIKLHAKIEHDEDDGLIELYIQVARASIEMEVGRSLRAETWRGEAERLPELDGDGRYRIQLGPRPDAIVSVEIDDEELDSDLYTLRGDQIVIDGSVEGPAGDPVTSGIVVTFTAGAAAIPPPLLLAIRMMAMHLHTNREPIANTWQAQPVPFTLQYLVQPFKALSIL